MERPDASDRLDELYRAHGRMVVAICGARLYDRHEAEDAAQQVFLSAYRAILKGTVPREPGAWLAVIARNECFARRRPAYCEPAVDDRTDGLGSDPPADVIRREEIATVWEAIAELPPTQRKALLLREVRGLSYAQLSEDLALSRPSVRSLLNRARRHVRLRLHDGFAALGGASWIRVLLELFGSGPGSAAPAVTRAAAAGLGVAALAGGAVVLPNLEREASRPPTRALPAHVRPVARAVTHPEGLHSAQPLLPRPLVASRRVVRDHLEPRHRSRSIELADVTRSTRDGDGGASLAGSSGPDGGSITTTTSSDGSGSGGSGSDGSGSEGPSVATTTTTFESSSGEVSGGSGSSGDGGSRDTSDGSDGR